jgi:hypothetical protein
MNTLASVAFGAVALAAASIGFAQPAAARSNVGIYVSPFGIAIGVDQNRNYCSDDWYRRNHWNYCSQFYGGYDGYYNNFNGGYYGNAYRYSARHDRDDRGGGGRHDQGNRGGGQGGWSNQGGGDQRDHHRGR